MKNVTIKNVLLSLTSTLAVACGTSSKTTASYEKSANFSAHKTFRIDMKAAPGSITSKNAALVVNSARDEMAKKGYKENTANPDLVVNIATLVKKTDEAAINTNQFGGFSSLRDQIYWGQYKTTPKATRKTDFSMVIAIADAATTKNVWQGSGNVEFTRNTANPGKTIDSTITKILAGFSAADEKH